MDSHEKTCSNGAKTYIGILSKALSTYLTPVFTAIVEAAKKEGQSEQPSINVKPGETSKAQDEPKMSASMALRTQSKESLLVEEEKNKLLKIIQELKGTLINEEKNINLSECQELACAAEDRGLLTKNYEHEIPEKIMDAAGKRKLLLEYQEPHMKDISMPKKRKLSSEHQEPQIEETDILRKDLEPQITETLTEMTEYVEPNNKQLVIHKQKKKYCSRKQKRRRIRELNEARIEGSNRTPFVLDVASTKRAYYDNKKALERAIKQVTNKVNEIENKLNTNEKAFYMIGPRQPIFSSCALQHPLNFIENLFVYFNRLPIERQTIDTIVECLQESAKDWAMKHKQRWSNIEDFKKDFFAEYWGMSSQNSLRRKIFQAVNYCFNCKSETMARYFMLLVSQAKWLPNKIPDDEIISEIMRHFPQRVQIAWRVSEKCTIIEAIEFLRDMDALKRETKEERAVRVGKKIKYKLRDDDIMNEVCKGIKIEKAEVVE